MHTILDEKEAILYAYKNAKPGSIITIMCDTVAESIELIKKLKEDEEKGVITSPISSLKEG